MKKIFGQALSFLVIASTFISSVPVKANPDINANLSNYVSEIHNYSTTWSDSSYAAYNDLTSNYHPNDSLEGNADSLKSVAETYRSIAESGSKAIYYTDAEKNLEFGTSSVSTYDLGDLNSLNNLNSFKDFVDPVTGIYQYPITPDDPEWKNLDSIYAKKAVTQIPQEIVENMETEALVETVLNYPIFPMAALFNDPTQALAGYMDFNGFLELFSREDAGKILLEKYEQINTYESAFDYDKRTRMLNIELLLGNEEIWGKLDSDNLNTLSEVAVEKYLDKMDFEEGYSAGTVSSFYKTLEMTEIQKSELLSLEPLDIVNEIIDESALTSLYLDDNISLNNKSKSIDSNAGITSYSAPYYAYVYTPRGTSVQVIANRAPLTGQERVPFI